MEKSFEGAVAQTLGHCLQRRVGPHGECGGLAGITEGGVSGIGADGAALFQERGIADPGLLTITEERLPQLLGQGGPEVED